MKRHDQDDGHMARRIASSLRLIWARPLSAAAAAFVLLVLALAIFAPLVTRYDPGAQDLTHLFADPSPAHWLGTDDLGRDVWSRLVFGARASMEAAAVSTVVAVVIGLPVGAIAGFFGHWIDAVLMRFVDTLLAFPAIVLAIGITAALGPGLLNAMISIGVIFSPTVARIIRAQVIGTMHHLYVEAAVSYGTSRSRLLLRTVLPNSIQPLVVQATTLMSLGLLAEASLSFLGLGVQPPTPSWGSMLRTAAKFQSISPYAVFAPGLAITLTVYAFNVLGDTVRDILDPVAAEDLRRRRYRRRKTTRGARPNPPSPLSTAEEKVA